MSRYCLLPDSFGRPLHFSIFILFETINLRTTCVYRVRLTKRAVSSSVVEQAPDLCRYVVLRLKQGHFPAGTSP